MNLWLFKRIKEADWEQTSAVVVRAPDEFKARLLLGDGRDDHFNRADVSRCTELAQDGPEGVIITDYKYG